VLRSERANFFSVLTHKVVLNT